jgi:hypothetical protein
MSVEARKQISVFSQNVSAAASASHQNLAETSRSDPIVNRLSHNFFASPCRTLGLSITELPHEALANALVFNWMACRMRRHSVYVLVDSVPVIFNTSLTCRSAPTFGVRDGG